MSSMVPTTLWNCLRCHTKDNAGTECDGCGYEPGAHESWHTRHQAQIHNANVRDLYRVVVYAHRTQGIITRSTVSAWFSRCISNSDYHGSGTGRAVLRSLDQVLASLHKSCRNPAVLAAARRMDKKVELLWPYA